MANITAPSTRTNYRVVIDCTPDFTGPVTITKQVVFEGEQSAFQSLDCKGGTINPTRSNIPSRDPDNPDSLIVRSLKINGNWSVPSMVSVRNCNIKGGGVRVYGLGRNAAAAEVKQSSFGQYHTMTVRSGAPYLTQFYNVSIVSPKINLFSGPGTVNLELRNSRLENTDTYPVIYLEAESIGADITNNEFTVANPAREFLSVDGSDQNLIVGNVFNNPVNGGISLYRNCGEFGTIRHQTPSDNKITGNRFVYTSQPKRHGIWIGSRSGMVGDYCGDDNYSGQYSSLLPYSSSPEKRNGDFAYFNTVQNNVFVNWPFSPTHARKIVSEIRPGTLHTGQGGYDVNTKHNTISGNVIQ